MSDNSLAYKVLITIICLVVGSFLAIILITTLAYIPRENLNNRLEMNQCEVLDHIIAPFDRNLFHGIIEVAYLVNNETIISVTQVLSNYRSSVNLLRDLAEEYPIGEIIDCFYDPENISDVRTREASLVGSIVGLTFSSLILFSFIVCVCAGCWFALASRVRDHIRNKIKDKPEPDSPRETD